MADWIKTAHYHPESWPDESGYYWIVARDGGRREVFLAYWNINKGAFQLFANRVDSIPRGLVTHYKAAEVPELPPEAG